MSSTFRYPLWAGLLASTVALAGCSAADGPPGPANPATERVHRPAVVETSFPGLEPATGEPDLAGLHTASPSPGEVLQVVGPFDDRLVLQNPAFDGTAVTGSLRITSDVSDLLELQVLAGFHDDHGTLLGTARFTSHLGDDAHSDAGPPDEQEVFKIPVPPELQGSVASATIGVPVLVNE
jgi:hypothetical protein